MGTRITILPCVLSLFIAGAAAAQCDPNDPVTGLPDLQYSFYVWSAAGSEPVSLLVVPDGSGAPFTQARRAAGSIVDATITLTLMHPCGPFANFPREDIWLETPGAGFIACAGGTIADVDTDAEGTTRWTLPLRAGGFSPGPCVIVINGSTPFGMPPLDLSFKSPDLSGDLAVNLADVARFAPAYLGVGGYSFAADLLADGNVDLADIPVLARSIGAHCP